VFIANCRWASVNNSKVSAEEELAASRPVVLPFFVVWSLKPFLIGE
jgi:hypothetical protein